MASRSRFSLVRRTRQSKSPVGRLAPYAWVATPADDEIVDAVTIERLDHPGDVRSDGFR
jgi:hypothetical protein